MAGPTDLLQYARIRAEALRLHYRADGVWSGEPVDVVRVAAARRPSGLAVKDRRTALTYAELDERVERACQSLINAGVKRSTPVLLVVDNDVDSVVAVHAGIRADAVVLLVPRSAGAAQIADIAACTGATIGIPPGEPSRPNAQVHPVRPADEPSFVLFTSGTTSRPKGVIHSLSTLIKASSNYIEAAGLGSDDRIFLISPLGSVTGIVQALFIAPMLSAPVVLEDRWEPASTCELLVSTGSTWYGGPDRLLDRLLDQAVAANRPVPLEAVYLGGTMLDRRIVERIEDDFGIVVMRAYGSSEVPVSTSGLRDEPRDRRHADDGVALSDVEVRVGSVGDPTECCIRGPHTFLGYTDAAADEQAFDGDWFRTGDVAEVTDGRVRVVGRLRDIVIRNGMKIPVAEVEEAVARIAGVRECTAYSVDDAATGERLAVAVVLDAEVEMSLATVADALTSAGLPKYKLPEELVIWDEPLPLNANGKVERNTLHERSEGKPRAVAVRLAPGQYD